MAILCYTSNMYNAQNYYTRNAYLKFIKQIAKGCKKS